MAKQALEFEKPILELEQKIEEMRRYADNPDIAQEIARIEKRVMQLTQSVYSGLTLWQRVQIARHPERPYTLDYINLMMKDFIEGIGLVVKPCCLTRGIAMNIYVSCHLIRGWFKYRVKDMKFPYFNIV